MIKRFKENEINELVNILKNNGVISVPTDTVYGLCSRIDSKDAFEKLIDVKNRPLNKSFPIMCANLEQIKNIAITDERSEKLIHAFMPGPITLILKKKDSLNDYINSDKDTVAIRMATSKVLEELIKKTGCPVFMTSANQSNMPTCTNLDEIETSCPKIDGMLEGDVTFGEASTIVDCTKEELQILRQGPITMEQIKKIYN